MTGYLNYLNIAGPIGIAIILFVFFAEIIKSGKVIFEFFASKVLKIKTKTAKKKEKEDQLADLIIKNNLDLQDFMVNQNKFNDEMKQELSIIREDVSNQFDSIRSDMADIRSSFTEISNTVTDMQLESMRETILEFASALSSPNGSVYTKEQFNYVRKIYRAYTEILKTQKKSDDEVDLSMIIINDKYEYNVLHHTFVEDLVNSPNVKHDIDEEVEKAKNKRSRQAKKDDIKKDEE